MDNEDFQWISDKFDAHSKEIDAVKADVAKLNLSFKSSLVEGDPILHLKSHILLELEAKEKEKLNAKEEVEITTQKNFIRSLREGAIKWALGGIGLVLVGILTAGFQLKLKEWGLIMTPQEIKESK